MSLLVYATYRHASIIDGKEKDSGIVVDCMLASESCWSHPPETLASSSLPGSCIGNVSSDENPEIALLSNNIVPGLGQERRSHQNDRNENDYLPVSMQRFQ